MPVLHTHVQTHTQEHKRLMEEAKKRDHRMLGKKLDLFSLQEDAGGGLVFWHPKGSTVRRLIEDYWKTVSSKRHKHVYVHFLCVGS
jgi:threonyl-tRNA synthetase